jgi:hypothetical protein
MLADAGIGFLDGGPCPFYARTHTAEGMNLDHDAKSRRQDKTGAVNVVSSQDVGDSLQGFMRLMVRGWFEYGLAALQSCPSDIVLLCGSTSALVYSSICEALNVPFAVADDAPIVENLKFSPPRGFPMTDCDEEEKESQWDVYSRSVWRCLFEQGVNECRANIVRVPLTDHRACCADGTKKTRVALLEHGENDCEVCRPVRIADIHLHKNIH